jgi:hypothetical protein
MVNALNFANPIILAKLAADPSTPVNGAIYYNTVSNTVRIYQSGTWQDLSTGSSGLTGQSLNNHFIIVGDGSNLSAAVDTSASGDILADSTGALTIKSGVITNSEINASAAIALTKLAALTNHNRALQSDGSGFISESSVTSTELGYVSGVTSSIQTQLGGKASTALDNLASTAVNVDILPGTDNSINLGSSIKRYAAVNTEAVTAGAAALSLNGASINANSLNINNVADPVSTQDAATKNYVDNLIAGLSWKEPARVASIGSNIVILTAPSSIDGVTLNNGDRVLLKDQTLGSQNGIYVFNGAGSALTRATDMSTWAEVVGAVLLVTEGSVNQGSKWVDTNIAGGTLGTTAITFVAFSVAGTVNGSGTSGYVAYWNGTSTLTAEQYLSAVRGGTGGDSSGSTGVAHVNSGVWSYSQIVNADVSNTAAIAYSKLNLSGSIVNADIDASAAIAYSKLNLSASIVNADIASGAAIAYSKLNLSGSIVNADINASAAIAYSKLAALTVDRIVSTNHSTGFLTDADGSNDKSLISASFQRGASGSALIKEQYVDATTLTDNQSSAATAFSFALASFRALEISYLIETGAGTPDSRVGTVRVAANSSGSNLTLTDMFTESADCGVTWSAVLSGSTINVQYTSTNQGANRTMRADLKYFRA